MPGRAGSVILLLYSVLYWFYDLFFAKANGGTKARLDLILRSYLILPMGCDTDIYTWNGRRFWFAFVPSMDRHYIRIPLTTVLVIIIV